jgi:hypothetical protein
MPAFTRRQYAGAAAATTITAGINTTDTTCSLAATTGWPSTGGVPFYVVIDPGTSAEEKCSATISGSTLTLTRAQDDTTASSHSSGAAIYPVFTANDADEANELVAKLTTKGDLLVTTGSALNRLAVGTNAHLLTADSAATNGVKWALSPETDLVTTKGDLLVGTAADTLARQGVGANGSVLIADSAQTNGIAWSTAQTSNRNKIINGDFKIWQRGTSFTSPSFADYSADRWKNNNYNVAPTTYSITQQTFTPGTAPVAGYEGQFFYRSTITTVGSNTEYDTCFQRIEDVRTLAGQTVTLSFWAKSDSTRTTKATVEQNFGSGGSANASGLSFTDGTFTTTTSWQRFTFSFTLPSLSGKTIGTNSYLFLGFRQASASGSVLDIWGVQLEAGSVATPFEVEDYGTTLAKCQRYYEKTYNTGVNPATATQNGMVGNDVSASANHSNYIITRFPYKVTKRSAPTMTIYDAGGNSGKATVFNVGAAGTDNVTVTADFAGENSFRAYLLGTTSAGFTIHYTASAEL